MELSFVTSNPGKLAEVRAYLRPFGIRVRWSRRTLTEVQSDTLEDVVRAKLRQLRPSGIPQLVEDSGLFLDGLRGFPGVYSRFVFETIGVDGLLAALRGHSRTGVFRTVVGVRTSTRVWTAVGETRGSITFAPRGQRGFGYDPVFVPAGGRRTLGELSTGEKNEVSHRARAMAGVARRILGARPGPKRRKS